MKMLLKGMKATTPLMWEPYWTVEEWHPIDAHELSFIAKPIDMPIGLWFFSG